MNGAGILIQGDDALFGLGDWASCINARPGTVQVSRAGTPTLASQAPDFMQSTGCSCSIHGVRSSPPFKGSGLIVAPKLDPCFEAAAEKAQANLERIQSLTHREVLAAAAAAAAATRVNPWPIRDEPRPMREPGPCRVSQGR
jgi:hypothetical protein